MAKKSQAVAVLEGRLNLLKASESDALRALEEARTTRVLLEDVLKSIRAASAGRKGGAARGKGKGSVPIRQAMVEDFNAHVAKAAASKAAIEEAVKQSTLQSP